MNAGVFQFVHHRMPGERGVVGFHVQLDVLFQVVSPDEIQTGCRVEIVLMLGRFLGFRLKEELPFKADALGVLDGHVHKGRQVLEFAAHVGVVKVHITFADRPRTHNSPRQAGA